MQELKPRLQTVYKSVPINSVVADIGTDHAFLPIALIKGGMAKKVIACDISEGPLSVAQKNVNAVGVDNIELRLSDGLNEIRKGEVDVVTIAGMGGDIISKIILRAPWLKTHKTLLILQAMSSADVLRTTLNSEGYEILTEKGVIDSGRVYSVITARYTGNNKELSCAKKYIGELAEDKSDAATKYIKLQLSRITECAKSIENISHKQELYKEMCTAKKEIEKILEKRG